MELFGTMGRTAIIRMNPWMMEMNGVWKWICEVERRRRGQCTGLLEGSNRKDLWRECLIVFNLEFAFLYCITPFSDSTSICLLTCLYSDLHKISEWHYCICSSRRIEFTDCCWRYGRRGRNRLVDSLPIFVGLSVLIIVDIFIMEDSSLSVLCGFWENFLICFIFIVLKCNYGFISIQ